MPRIVREDVSEEKAEAEAEREKLLSSNTLDAQPAIGVEGSWQGRGAAVQELELLDRDDVCVRRGKGEDGGCVGGIVTMWWAGDSAVSDAAR